MSKEQEKRPEKEQEEVLVVAREALFPHGAHSGIRREGLEEVLEAITSNAQFLPRSQVENDSSWKQIIPYLVLTHEGKVFLMQRTEKHDEQRLASLFSLGIGGHIRRNEFVGQDIFAWAMREFREEVNYRGDFKIKVLGLLNDEANEVGSVHTGLVLLLEGSSPEITIRDEHKKGELITLDECGQFYDQMENWSKIVFDALREGFS